jgi:mono/diheme cytochrome c family protein
LVPEYVITVEVPIKNYLPKTKFFGGEVSNKGILKWKKQIAVEEEISVEELIAGKRLFKKLCAPCHKIDRALTGPALAGATFRFEQKWLYDFTRNSVKMINEGDSIALSLYAKWGTMMMHYPDLTDQEIKSIYDFIDYHSKRLPLKRLKEIHRENAITPADHFYYYSSSIQFPGWFCIAQRDIDKLVDQDYQIKLSLSKPERPSVALVFPGKTFIYKGRLNPQGSFFFSYEFDSNISLLPPNQDVLIVATAYKNGQTYLGVKESTVKAGFTEKIKMEAMPREEIGKRLKRIFQD